MPYVGPFVVICPKPFRGELLHLRYAAKDIQIEPFVPNRSIVELEEGVLLRLAGLDVVQCDPLHPCLFDQFRTDTLRH